MIMLARLRLPPVRVQALALNGAKLQRHAPFRASTGLRRSALSSPILTKSYSSARAPRSSQGGSRRLDQRAHTEHVERQLDGIASNIGAIRAELKSPTNRASSTSGSAAATIESSETKHVSPPQLTQPLPDLTKGIPSSFNSNSTDNARSDPQSLNITEAPATEDGSSGGGELPKGAYVSSLEKKRAQLARYLYLFLLTNVTVATLWFGRNWEDEEQAKKHPEIPSGWGITSFFARARARLFDTLHYYNEPAFPKLLPDPDPMFSRPYTLVLNMEDLLIHSEWSREHGWRMAKRPGLDYFLRYLCQYYEIVVWTSTPSMIAHPILTKLDPYRIAILYPLFREATKYENGVYIKDLSYLNRDLSKVIMVDTDSKAAKYQPENAIILPKWTGNKTDTQLVSLIPFLEYCATLKFDDLRKVLKSFEGTNIPQEFARRETIEREKQQKLVAGRKKKPKRGLGLMSALTGGNKSQMVGPDGMELPSLSDTLERGGLYQDYVRERGQAQYEYLSKQIEEHGAEWLKEMADEEKKMTDEAMQGMKSSLTSYIPFNSSDRRELFNIKDSGEAKPA